MSSLQEPLTDLAVSGCEVCGGTGVQDSQTGVLCDCVCRAVFRRCHAQFRKCILSAGATPLISLEGRKGPTGQTHYTWVRRNEDYVADFEMAARRALSPSLQQLFRWHYLLGASASLIGQRTGFHRCSVERLLSDMSSAVGRQIATTVPYSIYPPAEYMQAGPQIAA